MSNAIPKNRDFDPVTLEIFWNRLISIVTGSKSRFLGIADVLFDHRPGIERFRDRADG